MFSWIKRIAAPVAAIALLAVAAPTRATPVQFYTVGVFSGTSAGGGSTSIATSINPIAGNNFSQQTTVTVDNTTGDGLISSLRFDNSSQVNGADFIYQVNTGPRNVPFGQFVVTSTDFNPDDFNGIAFTLFFFLQQPTGGTGQLAASLTGTLFYDGGPVGSTLKLDFVDPPIVYVPDAATGVKFEITGVDSSGKMTISGGNQGRTTSLDGSISVPLPGVATAGLSMFGGLGGLTGLVAIRRRWLGVA